MVGIVQPQVYRMSFLLLVLVATFLLYPARAGGRARVTAADWCLVAVALAALVWPLVDFDRFVYRAATPAGIDLVLGTVTTLLVLEATRRTVGPILPVTAVAFVVYGYFGPLFELVGLDLFAHRGYDVARLVGTLYMTLEGIFGVPLDVAATYIVLFTIFGAVLAHSGAGQFFINWTMAAFGRSGSGAGPGRTVTISGFLLGTVSGSGVATTVTLGAVAWPLLRRAGFSAEVGGGILSASGIGAILAPPTMGAAMRFITSAPVPPLHMIGSRPSVVVALSITTGRRRRAAPRKTAWRSSARLPGRPPAPAAAQARSRYSSITTPVSALRPARAMMPTQTAMLRLYWSAYRSQNVPISDSGTADSTMRVRATERVLA